MKIFIVVYTGDVDTKVQLTRRNECDSRETARTYGNKITEGLQKCLLYIYIFRLLAYANITLNEAGISFFAVYHRDDDARNALKSLTQYTDPKMHVKYYILVCVYIFEVVFNLIHYIMYKHKRLNINC